MKEVQKPQPTTLNKKNEDFSADRPQSLLHRHKTSVRTYFSTISGRTNGNRSRSTVVNPSPALLQCRCHQGPPLAPATEGAEGAHSIGRRVPPTSAVRARPASLRSESWLPPRGGTVPPRRTALPPRCSTRAKKKQRDGGSRRRNERWRAVRGVYLLAYCWFF